MLVFGDLERDEDAAAIAAEIECRLDRCTRLEGLSRHQSLVAAFIRAGELVQGVCDAVFTSRAVDDVGPLQEAGSGLLLALAHAVGASWDSGFTETPPLNHGAFLRLLSEAGPIRTRQAEGYAFYALYPEAYFAAARRSRLGPETTVIGIRSIGTGLAALVASAIGAREIHTVRPAGHPFDRRLALGPALAERLRAANSDFAIVDEGPGLSGSSFNCIVDWLTTAGVAESRIHIFPSHNAGLSGPARPDHRQRWPRLSKHLVGFNELILNGASAHSLDRWISQTTGPLSSSLRDLSGGQWRALRSRSHTILPADPPMERRKYLAVAGDRSWLVKYAGLGDSGEARLALANRLADAGFGPRPAGLRHGFLVMPFLDDIRSQGEQVPLTRLADYLAFRASLSPDRPGASLEQLFSMAACNIGQLWGEPARSAVLDALGDPYRFAVVPCCTDNRMHEWEWLPSPAGWLKLDALDHHAAHDLVGCQDIAWDIAGAGIELGLSAEAKARLAGAVSKRTGRPLHSDVIAAHEICYLGFQLGLWSMARDRAPEEERETITRLLTRYAAHPSLRALLSPAKASRLYH